MSICHDKDIRHNPTSDITDRFLASNREKIIPTLSTILNRTISIVPVISFFGFCTISLLIDATVHGSSLVFNRKGLDAYISGNEYAYGGWRHSLIILIYFSCDSHYYTKSLRVPHRLFYHSLDCGNQNVFPNEVFVSDPLQNFRHIVDPHSVHNRELPLAMRRSTSIPKYGWDRHHPNIKPESCLASRWEELSQMLRCKLDRIAVHHYQRFMNFTTISNTQDTVRNYGYLITNTIFSFDKHSISLHAIDSTYDRILHCDRNSYSPRLRPISLSSPFSFQTWVTLVFLLIFCAIASSFALFGIRCKWTSIIIIKTILNSLFELVICLLEKDVGKKNSTKVLIGLLVICLGIHINTT
jgi:hypothetical protein